MGIKVQFGCIEGNNPDLHDKATYMVGESVPLVIAVTGNGTDNPLSFKRIYTHFSVDWTSSNWNVDGINDNTPVFPWWVDNQAPLPPGLQYGTGKGIQNRVSTANTVRWISEYPAGPGKAESYVEVRFSSGTLVKSNKLKITFKDR
jgi:hypothetical protein